MGIMDELYRQENEKAGGEPVPPSPPEGPPPGGDGPQGVEPTELRGLANPNQVGATPLGGSGGGGLPPGMHPAPRFQVRGGVEHPTRVRSSNVTLGLIAGAVAAAIGGVVWGVIAIQFSIEIGWVAWILGAFTGFMTLLGARRGSTGLGAAAACLAVMGLFIGKQLWLEVGVKGEIRQSARQAGLGTMYAANQRLQRSGVLQGEMQQMATAFGNSGDAMAMSMPAAPMMPPTDELMRLTQRYQELLKAEAAKVTYSESEAAIDELIEEVISAVPLHVRYGFDHWMDALWVILAVASAFGIARKPGA